MTQYINFDLNITSTSDHRIHTHVSYSPMGEHETISQDYLHTQSWYPLLMEFQNPRKRRTSIQELGDPLWRYLMPGPIEDFFRQSSAYARGKGKKLRLRLHHETLELTNIPWECALDPLLHDHIAFAADYSVVRYTTLSKPVPQKTFERISHLLFLGASPKSLPSLAVENELNTIASLAAVQFKVMGRAHSTWFDLQRGLKTEPLGLHFCGHCYWSGAEENEVALCLENPDGTMDLVPLKKLARELRGRHLQLIILNACETGLSNVISTDALTHAIWGRLGMAQGLIREGIPAVIAMLSVLSDAAAVAFSEGFYTAITKGLSFEEALLDARRAMSHDAYASWALPVFYLREEETNNETIVKPESVRQTTDQENRTYRAEKQVNIESEHIDNINVNFSKS